MEHELVCTLQMEMLDIIFATSIMAPVTLEVWICPPDTLFTPAPLSAFLLSSYNLSNIFLGSAFCPLLLSTSLIFSPEALQKLMRLYFIIKAKIKFCPLPSLLRSNFNEALTEGSTLCEKKDDFLIASVRTYLKWHLWFWLSRLVTYILLPLTCVWASCHKCSKGNARICLPPGEDLPLFFSFLFTPFASLLIFQFLFSSSFPPLSSPKFLSSALRLYVVITERIITPLRVTPEVWSHPSFGAQEDSPWLRCVGVCGPTALVLPTAAQPVNLLLWFLLFINTHSS